MQNQEANVIPIRKDYALFPPGLRTELEQCHAPDVIVSFEQVISAHLIAVVRRGAERLANRIVRKVCGRA